MFLIIIDYLKPMTFVDEHTPAHRAYLDECYQQGKLLISGPQVPRTGGVIIANVKTLAEVHDIIHNDPFSIHDVGTFNVIEFLPLKYHAGMAGVVN